MPWCPKCNAEYQDGYTECSDCGVALVDSLEEDVELVPFFQAENRKIANKLVKYFQYSNLTSEVSFDEENQVYVVYIPPDMEKHARKLYQAFYFVERDNIVGGKYKDDTDTVSEALGERADTDSEDAEDAANNQEPELELIEEEEDTLNDEEPEENEEDLLPEEEPEEEGVIGGAYVFKADRYRDLAGTVWIFLFFGVVGLGFVLLNVAGLLTVLNGWIPNIIMGALFIFFLYVAISTNHKAKTIRAEIEAENTLTEEIDAWLKENITKDFLNSLHDDNFSEELNYIKMTEAIKELLIQRFGNQNLSYLDRLVEEYYNNNF